MSISKIKRAISSGRERQSEASKWKHTGWQARVRVYEILPNGQPGTKLVQIAQNFLFEDGFNKEHAKAWESAQLENRAAIDRARRMGKQLPAAAIRRTIEDLAEHYFQHHDFHRLEQRSKVRIRGIVQDFLEWNRVHGRPYADLWTAELANRRINFIWDNYSGKGRQLRAGYEKKLFSLDMARPDRSVDRNPYPPIKQQKSKGMLTKPRAFTLEEMRAFVECSSPYEGNLWVFLANTGLREQEYHTLTVDRVGMKGAMPVDITIESHHSEAYDFKPKNKRDRTVILNGTARAAMQYLLAHRDQSGFVVRRDFSDRSHAYLRAFERTKRRVIARYPHMKDALSGNTPRTRTTPHTFRKTFVTNLLMTGTNTKTVADMIGDDRDTVENYYAAILDQDHHDAVHRLDNSTHHLEHSLQALIKANGTQPILDLLTRAPKVHSQTTNPSNHN